MAKGQWPPRLTCWPASVVDVIEVERCDDAQGLAGDLEVTGQGAAYLAIERRLQRLVGTHM